MEKEFFLDDHSIFYSAVRDSKQESTELTGDLYDTNKRLYLDYIELHEKLVSDINKKLSENGDTEAFLFGAHVQAQYLIGFGLNISEITMILDNDSKKHGKRLFGTDKQISSPSVLRNLKSPIVIVRAGTFTNEIVSQIKSINPSTQFII